MLQSSQREKRGLTRSAALQALALAAVLFAHTGCVASEDYLCAHLAAAPVLDGTIAGDPAWEGVPEATGFSGLDTGVAAAKQTRFRLGYTGRGLYVGFICDEPDMDAIEAYLDDGEALWDEDSVELFFSPDGKEELQFVVSAMGSRACPRTLARWQAATALDETSWSAEIFIPWEVLDANPPAKGTWRFNACRTLRTMPEGKLHTTWAKVQGSFHDVANFSALRFDNVNPLLREAIATRLDKSTLKPFCFLFSRPRTGLIAKTQWASDRVLYNQGAHLAPRLSPDGTQFLLTSGEGDGTLGIWLADRDGNKRRLCDGRRAAWAPDGTRFVFELDGVIFERGLDASEARVITGSPEEPMTWPEYHSSDGFIVVREDKRLFYHLHSDGTLEELGRTEDGPARPSPDGKLVAFASGAHLWLLDLETKEKRQLTFQPGLQCYPVWGERGRHLCFLATADPFVEKDPFGVIWNIFHIALDDPLVIDRIERNVSGSFDWYGGLPEESTPMPQRGGPIQAWGDSDPPSIDELRNPKAAGWTTAVEATQAPHVTLRTAWLSLRATMDGLLLESSREDARNTAFRLSVVDTAGKPVPAEAFKMVRAADETCLVFTNGCRLTLHPNTPVVHATGRLRIEAAIDTLIVPDRFGDDLLLRQEDLPAEAAPLPAAPFYLAALQNSDALLMFMPGEAGAVVSATDAGWRLDMVCGYRSLALLDAPSAWRQLEAAPDEAGAHATEFKRPFQAQWRCAIRAGSLSGARTWNTDALSSLSGKPMPLPRAVTEAPDNIIAYLFGREAATPTDIWTPLDVLLDSAFPGRRRFELKRPGLQTFHPVGLAARTLSTRPATWQPCMGHTEKKGFGVLEILAGAYVCNTPGIRDFVAHLTADARTLLRGLDARIAAYNERLPELATEAKSAGLQAVAASLEEALTQAAALPCTPLTELDARADELKADRSGGGACSNDGAYNQFREACKARAEERLNRLRLLRPAARDARNAAGLAILRAPACRDAAEVLRAGLAGLLANRHYMEADWRGETPFSRGSAQPWH